MTGDLSPWMFQNPSDAEARRLGCPESRLGDVWLAVMRNPTPNAPQEVTMMVSAAMRSLGIEPTA